MAEKTLMEASVKRMRLLAAEALTPEVFTRLKEIEATAYAHTSYRALCDYETFADMADDYMECPISAVRVLLYPHAYLLLAEYEDEVCITDFASEDHRTDIRTVIRDISSFQKPFSAFCRETTSYKLIRTLSDHNCIVVAADETQEWEGEIFHSIYGMSTELYKERQMEEERE